VRPETFAQRVPVDQVLLQDDEAPALGLVGGDPVVVARRLVDLRAEDRQVVEIGQLGDPEQEVVVHPSPEALVEVADLGEELALDDQGDQRDVVDHEQVVAPSGEASVGRPRLPDDLHGAVRRAGT